MISKQSRGDATEDAPSLFGCDLILHFGYHKCLTVLYHHLMMNLIGEFDFKFAAVWSNKHKFRQATENEADPRVVLSTDIDGFDWNHLPEYRGSHFIRDPRDMVVSGYYYHLWTKEAWCVSPNFNWNKHTKHPLFEHVEPDKAKWPHDISYQDYLNSLDEECGMLMEVIFCDDKFQQMRRWDFDNPRILELRYDDIVGAEESAFSRLFDHYGFHPDLRDRGLEVVERLSLKNQVKKEGTHVRSGKSGQWKQRFTPKTKQLFKQVHADLLVKLDYERDENW